MVKHAQSLQLTVEIESTCTHKMHLTCKITKDVFVYVYRRKGYSRGSSLCLHVFQSVLYVVQVGWGCLLLLVVMSFNGWLFLSVCFGAGVGFFLFARLRHHSPSAQDKKEHCHWSTLCPVTCLADSVYGVVGCILHSLLFFLHFKDMYLYSHLYVCQWFEIELEEQN